MTLQDVMKDESDPPKWLTMLVKSASVEMGFHPAESWNEGVQGKRYKRKPIDLVQVHRNETNWVISGPRNAVVDFIQGMVLLGFITPSKIHQPMTTLEGGKLFVKVDC